MSRRELREHIFKMLFRIEFHEQEEMGEQSEFYFDTIENLTEDNMDYMREKLFHIISKIEAIDEKIAGVSQGWKIERMGKVDITVLRLAVYEIVYDESIPTGVAINEAVELAKKFGGEDSFAFINGILGKIAS